MNKKILINGKEVTNIDDLPESIKNILLDDNGNGIPDIAENPFALFGKMGDLKGLMKSMPDLQKGLPQLIQSIQQGGEGVNINGKEYKSLADIPESDKAELKAQFSQIKHLNPEKIGGLTNKSQESTSATKMLSQVPLKKRSEIPTMTSPAIQEQQDKNRVAIFILALLALGGYVIAQYAVGA